MLVKTGHHHLSVDNRPVTAAVPAEDGAARSDGIFCRLFFSGFFRGQQVVPGGQDSAVVRVAAGSVL